MTPKKIRWCPEHEQPAEMCANYCGTMPVRMLLINPDEGIWISCPHCGFSEGFEDEVPWQVIIHSCAARQPRFESEQMTNWNPPGPCPNCGDQHPTREEHWRCGECNTLQIGGG